MPLFNFFLIGCNIWCNTILKRYNNFKEIYRLINFINFQVGNLVDSNERIFEKQGSFFQRGGAPRGEGRQRGERPRDGWGRRQRNRRRDDERAHED